MSAICFIWSQLKFLVINERTQSLILKVCSRVDQSFALYTCFPLWGKHGGQSWGFSSKTKILVTFWLAETARVIGGPKSSSQPPFLCQICLSVLGFFDLFFFFCLCCQYVLQQFCSLETPYFCQICWSMLMSGLCCHYVLHKFCKLFHVLYLSRSMGAAMVDCV